MAPIGIAARFSATPFSRGSLVRQQAELLHDKKPCAYRVVRIPDRLLSFSPISCTLSRILSVSLEHRDRQTLDPSSPKLTRPKPKHFILP